MTSERREHGSATRWMDSPLGGLRLIASDRGVTGVWLGSPRARSEGASAAAAGMLDRLESALAAFFAGQRGVFDIPLDAPGTPFQREVWGALMEIPAGQTRSYADVARTIGRPAAVRAVARANATNPVAIVVPCHRVIGSDGSLTGYGGGLERKRWLLDHERKHWGADLFAGV